MLPRGVRAAHSYQRTWLDTVLAVPSNLHEVMARRPAFLGGGMSWLLFNTDLLRLTPQCQTKMSIYGTASRLGRVCGFSLHRAVQ